MSSRVPGSLCQGLSTYTGYEVDALSLGLQETKWKQKPQEGWWEGSHQMAYALIQAGAFCVPVALCGLGSR